MRIDGVLNADDMLFEVKRWVAASGSQKKAAKLLGVSEQYISDVLKGRREVGPTLSEALGYNKIVMFSPLPKQKKNPLD